MNSQARDAIPYSLLHRHFEIQVLKTPNNDAVQFGHDEPWSYDKLNKASNRLARYLESHHPAHSPIAIYMEKSPLLVVAVLATLKANMVTIPLHLDSPATRLEDVLESCNCQTILTIADPGTKLSGTIRVDNLITGAEYQHFSDSNLNNASSSEDSQLCNILFTSGSTGIPKGVKTTHKAVAHNALVLIKMFSLGSTTKTLQFAAPTFSIFSMDIFMSLLSGGCLVMSPRATIMADITTFMHQSAITYCHTTPTVLRFIDPVRVPSLKVVVSGGEVLPAEIAKKWITQTSCSLWSALGSTETLLTLAHNLRKYPANPSYVGQAIPGMKVALLKPDSDQEVAEGQQGEICISGPQLFAGYLSLETVTLRQIIRDGTRFYRTGDIGVLEKLVCGEKSIRYIGRRDSQVKINGIRLDLGDVESSLATCSLVNQGIALIPQSGNVTGQLSAVITLNSAMNGAACDNSEPVTALRSSPMLLSELRQVRDHIHGTLPAHAIPRYWWILRYFPSTATGKIDRFKIRTWLEQMDRLEYLLHIKSWCSLETEPASSNSLETRLENLWAEVLDLPKSVLRPDVSFLEFGADSLTVIRLVSRGREVGLLFTYEQVFFQKTIQRLAQSMLDPSKETVDAKPAFYSPFTLVEGGETLAELLYGAAADCGISVESIEDIYPTTPLQAGLMALSLKNPGSYVCSFTFTLSDHIRVTDFKTAWERVKAATPILRNRLIWEPSTEKFLQVTVAHRESTWDPATLTSAMFAGDELCRESLFWNATTETWIFELRIHHSIVDGTSFRYIMKALQSVYENSPAPSSRPPYTHFIRYHVEEQSRTAMSSQIFWQTCLEGASVLDYPNLPRNTNHVPNPIEHQSISVRLDMQNMAKQYCVTSTTIIYAAIAKVLGEHTDSDDVIFGITLSGRNSPVESISDMIGPIITTLPFRVHLDSASELSYVLGIIEKQILNLIPHQHFGLQSIRKAGLGAEAACQFRCQVVVQPADEDVDGESMWKHVGQQSYGLESGVPLALELIHGGDHLRINCNFDASYISRTEIGIFLKHLDCALTSFSKSTPNSTLSDINLCGEAEMSTICAWASSCPPVVRRCIHDIVKDSCQMYGSLTAIIDERGRRILYSELDLLSTRLSLVLQLEHGIKNASIVPIIFGKSPTAIITMIAILKAGACYVPIEPTWPMGRIRSIIHDANAKIILCSEDLSVSYSDISAVFVEVTDAYLDTLLTKQSLAPLLPPSPASPSDLAVILFTSGSTGKPKGVMLHHEALATSLTYLSNYYENKPGTRVLGFSSFTFDASVADIFTALFSGSTICLPSDHSRLNSLPTAMNRLCAETALLTPSVASLITPSDVPTLKTLLISGESATRALIDTWAAKVSLKNCYGPTECSIIALGTTHLTLNSDPSNIGVNVTGLAWVVRQTSDGIRPAPIGCKGEIAISGFGVTQGYFKNPELTEKTFVYAPHLFKDSLTYLTGDIGSYQPDGSVQILGRRDTQVKINGVRVEPSETEHHLRRLGGRFSTAVVQAVESDGASRICAFVVVEGGTKLDHIIIPGAFTQDFQETCFRAQAQLRDVLPNAFVPTKFVPITYIPSTTSGKTDRKTLNESFQRYINAKLTFNVSSKRREIRTASTPSERAIESVFREVFTFASSLSMTDSFFELGGDSFIAIRVVLAARKLGFAITVQQVFSNHRLHELAAVATPCPKLKQSTNEDSLKSIECTHQVRVEAAKQCNLSLDEIESCYPASPFQEALASLSLRKTGSEERQSYLATMVFKIPNTVDDARLLKAIRVLIARNPILRTRITNTSEGTIQVVCKSTSTSKKIISQKNSRAYNTSLLLVNGGELFHHELRRERGNKGFRLILTVHHAIYDAWSLNKMFEDLKYNYTNPGQERKGRKPYSHFIHHLACTENTLSNSFWATTLDQSTVTNFPPLFTTDTQKYIQYTTKMEASVDLKLSRAVAIAPASLITAALGLLISLYCNSEDVCFGTVLFGRESPLLEDIGGPTLSTVPVRIRCPKNAPVTEFLKVTQAVLIEMREHQHYGLQNISRLGEGSQNACKFETLLVIQQDIVCPKVERVGDLVMEPVAEETTMNTEYPLILNILISPATGHIKLEMQHDTTRLSIVQGKRIATQLLYLTSQLAAAPNSMLKDLEFVTEQDKAEICSWNPNSIPSPQRSLHGMFEYMVSESPDSLAIECTFGLSCYQSLSYRQLDDHATALSQHLMNGSLSNPLVGLYFPKSPLAIIAILAVLKAGKAFVPIDPAAPEARLQTILDDIGLDATIITNPQLAQTLSSTNIVILNDTSRNPLQEKPKHESSLGSDLKLPPSKVRPESLAYVLYTSGSSGKPKGVKMSHNAICTSLTAFAPMLGMNRNSRFLQYSAYSWDAFIAEIFGSLISGGCVCILPDSQKFSGELERAIRDLNVTALLLTPTVAQFLDPRDIPTVSSLCLGGESPPPELLRRWRSHAKCRTLNAYGPTESAVIATINTSITPNDLSNIGVPIASCKCFITDPSDIQKLAPVGAIGELIICGPTLADGYLNMHTETEAAFGTSNMWTGTPLRYYKTGDLARYSSDEKGSIIYVGRNDLQTKIHGKRIELGEIEVQVLKSGKFSACVVVILNDILVAFVLSGKSSARDFSGPLPPSSLSSSVLKSLESHLKSTLPANMIPSLYIPVDNWPLTSGGKVDRRSLSRSAESIMDQYRQRGQKEKRAPYNKLQQDMTKLWADVLQISLSEVGLDDSFDSLGGDSVKILHLLSRARAQNIDLSLQDIHQHKSLEEIVASLNGFDKHITTTIAPPPFSLIESSDKFAYICLAAKKCTVSNSSVMDVYPCSSTQELMMMASLKSPAAFSFRSVYRISPRIHIPMLETSLGTIWRQYETLRTRIFLGNDFRALQAVIDEPLDLVSYHGSLQCFSQTEGLFTFGYGEKLSRFAIVQDLHEAYLVLNQHHSVTDGWSLSLLIEEVLKQLHTNVSYRKTDGSLFSTFIERILEVQSSPNAEDFWRTNLAGLKPGHLPQINHKIPFVINAEYKTTLNVGGKSLPPLATLFEALWAILVSRYTNSEDVCFGVVRSGRTLDMKGIEKIIGPCLTTVPKRLQLSPDFLVADYLQQVKQSTFDALNFEHFGLDKIRNLSQDTNEACKFHSVVIIQPETPILNAESNPDLWPVVNNALASMDCLSVQVQPKGGDAEVSICYDDHAISPRDVEWIGTHLSQLLSEFSRGLHSGSRLRDIDMGGPELSRQTLVWNKSPIITIDRRVDILFRERLLNWTTLPAVVSSDSHLTYQELDGLSLMLATRLNSQGIKKGDMIPLFMEKSACIIITILAILHLGAAYVPLAIDYPPQRISDIVEAVKARMIICTPEQENACSHLKIPSISLDIKDLNKTPPNHVLLKGEGSTRTDGSGIAYILFTSGSTGKPKGVMIDHKALSTTIIGKGRQLGFKRGTRTLQFASTTFDDSVLEIWLTLLHGGCLYIPSENQRLGSLCKFINDNKIEYCVLTPTVVQTVLQSPHQVPSVTSLEVGAEPCSQRILDEWSPALDLNIAYGPTEACIAVTTTPMVTPECDPLNVGFALDAHLWVVDPFNYSRLAPVGCKGELLISGPTLATGYLNDEEKTTKSFIDGSSFDWILQGEERLYVTGDIVCRNPDGSVTFVSRRDEQIKLHGHRIELGEIENSLALCPGISGAVVDKVTLKNGNKGIVAWVTVDGEGVHSTGTSLIKPTENVQGVLTRAFSRTSSQLPRYMVPNLILPINEIPFTTSGKADRKSLRQFFVGCSKETANSYRISNEIKREPATSSQETLQRLWAQVLGIDVNTIGLDDEFVRLGGDSLSAIKLSSATRDIGFELQVVHILGNPTLEDMASVLQPLQTSAMDGNAVDTKEVRRFNGSDTFGNKISLTPEEQQLRSIWASILQRPELMISETDRFFQWGGKSSAITRLISSAADQNLFLDPSDVYAFPKLSEMAKRIQGRAIPQNVSHPQTPAPFSLLGMDDVSTIFSSQRSVEDILPASKTQLQFILDAQKTRRSIYMWFFVELDKPALLDRLREACKAVSQKHSILRTYFHLIDNKCYQVVAKNSLDFKVRGFTGGYDEICSLLDQEMAVPPPFGRQLARFRLFNNSDGSQKLGIGLCHSIYDGFSLPLLYRDLEAAYFGTLEKRPAPPFSRYVQHLIRTSQLPETNLFWAKTLGGCHMTRLFRPDLENSSSVIPTFKRTIQFTWKRHGGMSLAVVLKTAFTLTLSLMSSSNDITFGSLVSGRSASLEGVQEIVGPLINFIPARFRLQKNMTFMETMRLVMEQQIAMIPFESTPMAQIAREAGWNSATFGAIIAVQNLPGQNHQAKWRVTGGATYDFEPLGDVMLSVLPGKDGNVSFRLDFRKGLKPPPKVEVMLDLLVGVLETINYHPENQISTFISRNPPSELVYDHKDEIPNVANSKLQIYETAPIPTGGAQVLKFLEDLWVAVLPDMGERKIGVSESFFDLGGDEVSAGQLAILCTNTGLELGTADVIEFPTLQMQCLHLLGSDLREGIKKDEAKLRFQRLDEL